MGGRGAKNRTGTGGGGGTPARPTPQTPEQIINAALGPKGTPATIDEAVQRVNPNFSTRQHEWTHNCQRCVWAAEMQRRGYDVEAMPRTADNSYAMPDKSYPNSYLNVAEGGLSLEMVVPYWRSISAKEFKEHFTDKYEVGARGLIAANNKKSGHAINWEIIQGKNGKQVRFYDTQPNGLKRSDYNQNNLSVTTLKKNWFFFREARMDNVAVTQLIKDFVRPRGGTA